MVFLIFIDSGLKETGHKRSMTQSYQISMKLSFSLDTVQKFRFLDTNKSQWYDWWKVIQELLWLGSIRLLLQKKIIHYKRRSKQRWQWGRGWRNKNLVSKRQSSQEQKCRYRRMVVWKRTKKSTCCLLFARFLFVKLFIEAASFFTWRGRREGVSWVGERIS